MLNFVKAVSVVLFVFLVLIAAGILGTYPTKHNPNHVPKTQQ